VFSEALDIFSNLSPVGTPALFRGNWRDPVNIGSGILKSPFSDYYLSE
jgi:hypothetical protein